MLNITTFQIGLDEKRSWFFIVTFYNMEENANKSVRSSYPVLVRFNQEFLKEVTSRQTFNPQKKRVVPAKTR